MKAQLVSAARFMHRRAMQYRKAGMYMHARDCHGAAVVLLRQARQLD